MEESEDLKIKFKKTKTLNRELSALMDDIIEDLVYREVKVEIAYISVILEEDIGEVFGNNSSWDLLLSVNWSNYVMNKFTTGLIGLVGDMGYFYSAPSLFEEIILDKMTNNKDFVNYLKKLVENELNSKFDSNFDMSGITQAGFHPVNEEGKEGFNLNLTVKTRRE